MSGFRCILLLMTVALSTVVALPFDLQPSSGESNEPIDRQQLFELKRALEIINGESGSIDELRRALSKAYAKQDTSLEVESGEPVHSDEDEYSSVDNEQHQRVKATKDEYLHDKYRRLKRHPIEDPEPIDHSKCTHSHGEHDHADQLAHEHRGHKHAILRSVRAAVSSSSEEHGDKQNQSVDSSEEQQKQAVSEAASQLTELSNQPVTESQAARRKRYVKDNDEQLISMEDTKKEADKSSDEEDAYESNTNMGSDATEFDDYALGCEVKEVDSKEANETIY